MAKVERNASLTYNQLGKTDMVVSNISLGGAAFGNVYQPMEQSEVNKAVNLAIDSGINLIDTAPWYGQGKSEERLGEALKSVPREKFYLATKVGRYDPSTEKTFDFSVQKTEKSFKESLDKLQVDYVDLIQIHDVEFCASVDQLVNHTLPTLQKFKREGKAKYIGITGYTPKILKKIIERAPPGSVDVILSYCRMNLLNQDLLECMEFFKSRGIGVINASAVAMGMLAGPTVPEWHIAHRSIKDASMKAWDFCKSKNENLAELAIQWVFAQKDIVTTLMSIQTKQQMSDNLSMASKMSNAQNVADLMSNPALVGAKAIFDDLASTDWDNLELARYWSLMREGKFKQNLD